MSTLSPAIAAATEPAWKRHYPFSSHELAIDGHRYHYLDEGQGEPLLFVHGNPTWSFHWRELIQAWRGRYRTIAPDHLGCGLSDKPQNWPYRLEDHIDNLVRLVEHLDLRNVTLLAHDWGGAIGLGAALRLSDRFRRIVLFNTAGYPPWFIPWRIRACRIPVLGKIAVQGGNLFAHAALRMTMERPERLTPAERSGYLAPYDCWQNRIAINRFVEDIPLSPKHPTYRMLAEIEAGLPTLADHPTELIWGMRDWCFTPACLDKFIELLPHAGVHRLDQAGHWVVEDAREQVISLVEDFLTANPLAIGDG